MKQHKNSAIILGMKLYAKDKTINFSILLFVTAILSRIPFITKYLYYWDSVNFALGLDRYNVFEFRPAPPGYFLYIYITKLIYPFFVKEANLAFIIVGIVSCAIASVMVFLFTKKVFSVKAGIAASLIFISSPVIFFHSITAFTYMLDGMFISLFVYFCYSNLDKPCLKNSVLMAVLLGLASGVRQQDIVLLFPLYIFSLCYSNIKETRQKTFCRDIFISLICLGLVFLSWFIPMIILSGGFEKYLEACRLQGQCGSHGGILGYLKYFIRTEGKLIRILAKTITIGFIPLIASLFLFDIKKIVTKKGLFFLVWIVPCLVFWYGFHLSNVGHTFTCLFSVFSLLGAGIVLLSEKFKNRKKVFEVLCASCVIFNLIIFFYDPHPNKPFKKKTFYREEDVRKRSDFLGQKIKFIKKNFNPNNTIIFADTGGSGNLAQAAYYLEDYEFYNISCFVENDEKLGKTAIFTKGREYVKVIKDFKVDKNIKKIVLFDRIYKKYLENKDILRTINLKRGVTIDWVELPDNREFNFNYKKWNVKVKK